MPTFGDIPVDAVYIGTFADEDDFASFVEDVWCDKLPEDCAFLPTGESGSLWPAELVSLWLRNGTVAMNVQQEYFWLSPAHAKFWGKAAASPAP